MISFFMSENVHPPYNSSEKELDSEWDRPPMPPESRVLSEGEVKKPKKRISAVQKRMDKKLHSWKMATLCISMITTVLLLVVLMIARDTNNFELRLKAEIQEHGQSILYQKRLIEERNFEITTLKEKLGRKSDIRVLSKINSHIELLEPSLDPNVRMIISKAIEKWCNKYNLSYSLVTNLIYAETLPKFNIFSKSPKDCVGLMQINFKVHKKEIEEMKNLKVEDLYHIDTNIKFGCMILRGYIDKSNSPTAALRKYVGGTDLKYIHLIYEKMALWEINNYEKSNEVDDDLQEVQQTDDGQDKSE